MSGTIEFPRRAQRVANAAIGFALLIGVALCCSTVDAQPPRNRSSDSASSEKALPSGIAWYGVLEDGLAEAKASNKPIMLLSAAPQCTGVPGIW